MKHDHPPVTPHGVAPHDHKHEHIVDTIEEHSAGGHVHHSKIYKEHAAGHKLSHEIGRAHV